MCLCVKVVRNSPGHPSTNKSWSHEWREMVPLIEHTSKYRHISTNWSTSRSVKVDIDIDRRSTYGRIRSISTRTVDPPMVDIDIDSRSTYGTHRRKSTLNKRNFSSVPVSKHSNILYWLRYLHFHRPHLDLDHGFQVFEWKILETTRNEN